MSGTTSAQDFDVDRDRVSEVTTVLNGCEKVAREHGFNKVTKPTTGFLDKVQDYKTTQRLEFNGGEHIIVTVIADSGCTDLELEITTVSGSFKDLIHAKSQIHGIHVLELKT